MKHSRRYLGESDKSVCRCQSLDALNGYAQIFVRGAVEKNAALWCCYLTRPSTVSGGSNVQRRAAV